MKISPEPAVPRTSSIWTPCFAASSRKRSIAVFFVRFLGAGDLTP